MVKIRTPLIKSFIKYFVSVLVLIALIPVIKNDYVLAVVYTVAILIAMTGRFRDGLEWTFVVIGFVAIGLSEYYFVSVAKVETFTHRTLFGLMPFWLPFLWAFIFLGIKRVFWAAAKNS